MWGKNRKRSLFNLTLSISTQHCCSLRALTYMTNIRQRGCSALGCSKTKLSQSHVKPVRVGEVENQEDTLHPQIPGQKTSTGLHSPWTLTLSLGVSSVTASPCDICQAFLQAKSVCLSVLVAPWTSKSEGHQHPTLCISDRMGVPGLSWVPLEFLSSHWSSWWAPQLNTLLTSHWAVQKQISTAGRPAVTSSPMEYMTSDPCL